MSYQVEFNYVFSPENPDSIISDVAWRARILENDSLICIASNHGKGTSIQWLDEPMKDEMLARANENDPDSIDPLRDYIDYLLEEHIGNQEVYSG